MEKKSYPSKRIYLLIGPKGSGKSFIGTLLQQVLGITFLRVEDLALSVKKDRSPDDSTYVGEVFRHIESVVREKMQENSELIFESTGLTDAFDRMLQRLQDDFRVILIRVEADPGQCLERIKSRDQSRHVEVSDAQILAINRMCLEKAFPFDGVIDNRQAGVESILADFEKIRDQDQ